MRQEMDERLANRPPVLFKHSACRVARDNSLLSALASPDSTPHRPRGVKPPPHLHISKHLQGVPLFRGIKTICGMWDCLWPRLVLVVISNNRPGPTFVSHHLVAQRVTSESSHLSLSHQTTLVIFPPPLRRHRFLQKQLARFGEWLPFPLDLSHMLTQLSQLFDDNPLPRRSVPV